MEDDLGTTASCNEELKKKIGLSGSDKELVSPEHEEYCTESYDQVYEFIFDVVMYVIEDEETIEQEVADAISA